MPLASALHYYFLEAVASLSLLLGKGRHFGLLLNHFKYVYT